MRILLADDDPLMRAFVGVCLRDLAEIRNAVDGVTALSALKQGEIDLLLLDWDMPAPDGLAVLKAVRAKGFKLPVIMVTGEASQSRVLDALAAGASDYLIKPFEAAAIRAKVQKFCKPIAPDLVAAEK